MIVPSMFGAPLLTKVSRAVAENSNLKMLGTEILGSNLPKMTIVRNLNESLDMGVNDVGNTIGFFGGLHYINKWCGNLIKSRGLKLNPNPNVLSQGRVLKSLAILPPLFAWMWATAFIRNAVTVWRSGSTDFRNLITTKGSKHDKSKEAVEKRKEVVNTNLKKTALLMGLGIGASVLGAFLTLSKGPLGLFNSKGNLKAGAKIFEPALKFLSLKGADGKVYGQLQAVLFWILPGNLGFMTSARDSYELKEAILKTSNFAIFYPMVGIWVKKAFARKTAAMAGTEFAKLYKNGGFLYRDAQALQKTLSGPAAKKLSNIIRFENMKFLTENGLTIFTLNVVPALLNIYLTWGRIRRADAEAARRRGRRLAHLEAQQQQQALLKSQLQQIQPMQPMQAFRPLPASPLENAPKTQYPYTYAPQMLPPQHQ